MEQIRAYLESSPVFTPAVVCFIRRGNEVLLGLRKKVSLGLGENLISGIGGKVGDSPEIQDESNQDALIREVREEIGVIVREFREMGRVRFIFPHKPLWNQDVRVYSVSQWEGIPQETDAIKPIWFAEGQLPVHRMWHDNGFWLPKVLAGESVNAVFLFGEDNKVIESLFE